MKKFISLIISLIVIVVIMLFTIYIVYNRVSAQGIPASFKDKLVTAHKDILLFKYNHAKKMYAAAVKQTPSPQILEEYLAFLVSQEDLATAYKVAQIIFKYNPNHLLANLVNTTYLIKKNRLNVAIEDLKSPAQDASSFNNAIYTILTNIYYFINNNQEEFQQEFTQIKHQLPSFYYNQLVLYNILLRKYQQAMDVAQEAVNNSPDINIVLLYSKMLHLSTQKNNIDKSYKLFRTYLDTTFLTDKSIAQLLDNYPLSDIGLPYIVSNAIFEISKSFSEKIKTSYLNPDKILLTHIAAMLYDCNSLARIQLASFYIGLGDYTTALNNLNRIPKTSFYYHVLYKEISNILIELGNPSAAIEQLSTAYNQDKNNPEPLLELGHLYYKQHKYPNSIWYYTKALKVATNNKQPLGQWLAYYFRGIAYNANNNWQQASKDLWEAYKLNNKDPLLLNYLGYLLIKNDINPDKGLAMVQAALKIQPHNANFLDSYALGLYKKNQFKKALEVELKAQAKLPLDSSISNNLGNIYYKLHNTTKAKYYWHKSLNTNPDSTTRADLQNKLELSS